MIRLAATQHLGLALVALAGMLAVLPVGPSNDEIAIVPDASGPNQHPFFPMPGFTAEHRDGVPDQPGLFGLSHAATIQVFAHLALLLGLGGVALLARPLWHPATRAEAS